MPQKILIAEDDRAFGSMIQRTIEGAGYECTVASDGVAAMQAVREHNPDLILLDLLLPKQDGRTVLAKLQAKAETADIPVVAMSGVYRGRSTARELQDAGAQGFLEKPFAPNDLVAHLHALIGPPSTTSAEEESRDTVSIQDRSVAEALWESMSGGFSGALQLKSGKLQKVIVLRNGKLVQVRSNAARECLGRRLLRAGRITEQQLQESLRRTQADGARQGEVLVEMGLMTEEDVEHELIAQAEDKLLDPFSWTEGQLWRQPGVKSMSYASDVTTLMPHPALLKGVARMAEKVAIDRLRQIDTAVLTVEDDALADDECALPHVRRALAEIGPGTTVSDLLPPHARALFGLWLVGAVKLALPDGDPVVAPRVFEDGACEGEPVTGPGQFADLSRLKQKLEGQNHFERLGLEEGVTTKDVRGAYLELAKSCHPDRWSGEPEDVRSEAALVFSLITEAHDTLVDPASHRLYVRNLHAGSLDKDAVSRIVTAEQKFGEGETCLKQRAYPQALACFKEALDLQPEEADHQAFYGWAYYLVNRGDESAETVAREHIEKAISLSPNSPTAHYLLGQLLKACDQAELAKKMFRQVLELQPGHVEAARELRLIEMRRGKGGSSAGLFGLGRKRK